MTDKIDQEKNSILISQDSLDDYFTSDIHLETKYSHNDEKQEENLYKTRIEFILPNLSNHKHEIKFDQDGDLIIADRHENKHVLYIEHDIKNKLNEVGYQLWRSSFYLSDFILNNLDIIKDKIVVDLGSGLGLTSFITCLYSKLVYCTDLLSIVQKAEHNWNLNKENLKDLILNKETNIKFKTLDWFNYENLITKALEIENVSGYEINKYDIENFKNSTVFLASDVIYDDLITINFFNIIFKLMTMGEKQTKTCYIANEKRINFSIEALAITDISYDFFLKLMNDLNEYEDESGFKFQTEEITTKNFKQYFSNYKRNEYLNIWKITCKPI